MDVQWHVKPDVTWKSVQGCDLPTLPRSKSWDYSCAEFDCRHWFQCSRLILLFRGTWLFAFKGFIHCGLHRADIPQLITRAKIRKTKHFICDFYQLFKPEHCSAGDNKWAAPCNSLRFYSDNFIWLHCDLFYRFYYFKDQKYILMFVTACRSIKVRGPREKFVVTWVLCINVFSNSLLLNAVLQFYFYFKAFYNSPLHSENIYCGSDSGHRCKYVLN